VATKRDFYEILGVAKNASTDVLNKAYRKLALKYHPDRNKDDPKTAETKFKEITEAYQILSDSKQRQAYDHFGHSGVKGGGAGRSGSEGFGFGGGGGFGDIFSDVFGDIFGSESGGRRASRGQRGSDLKMDIQIDFLDSAFGVEKTITIPNTHSCEDCHGSGADPKYGSSTCPQCQGSGQVNIRQGFFNISRTCDACRGEGVVIEKACGSCSGSGVIEKKSRLKVKVPPGIRSGQKLKMSGEGAAGLKGGSTGDLYIEVHVKDHELFIRDEDDIHLEVPITIQQAIEGVEIEIPTLHGNVKMKIPSGTQPGSQFRLKSKGVPNVGGYRFGDQLVKVQVEIPTNISREQKSHLKTFMNSINQKNHPKAQSFLKKVKNCLKK
jgi:molecular chaperone DnaJ